MRVFVLIFNARTDNEGLYSIRLTSPTTGEDHNLVLLFEAEDDATRFALMLEAQDFPLATVEAIEAEEIEEFCQEAGYLWKLVPEGYLLTPVEMNVEETDWKPEGQSEPEDEEAEPEFSNSELDQIRRRLEGLL